jgi:putative iron-dependent peroxidase
MSEPVPPPSAWSLALSRKQGALGAEPPAATSLAWRHRGDPAALWRALQALQATGAVIGIGAPLADAVGVELPGLRAFSRLRRGRYTMPATQLDVWALVPGPDAGKVFEHADPLIAALAPHAELVEATPLFSYRHGHDLSGYKDGSENPVGDAAWSAALVRDGEGAGGSHVLVQRWLHFRDRMAALPDTVRDYVVGRRLVDDVELAEAPESAHAKRTAQEDFDPPAFLLRRSMPWGDGRRHGLQFIAYAASLDTVQAQLERMMGLDDGLQDALLGHSQAETGAYYWCPPCSGRMLVLPAVSASITAPAARPAPMPALVRLRADGPLELEGALDIAGTAATQARLCRCGHSANKPWCDNRHLEAGFSAAGEVPPIDEPQVEVTAGTLRVQPMADGPLVLHGPVQVCSASGRSITRCHGPTLCRCGRSANKPFCDGAHAVAGFVAPQ